MKKEYELEKLIPTDLRKHVSEKRTNGMFLSDYQIEVLQSHGFSYQKYSSIKELLFDVEDYLNTDYDSTDNNSLDLVASELAEREYYNHTNQ